MQIADGKIGGVGFCKGCGEALSWQEGLNHIYCVDCRRANKIEGLVMHEIGLTIRKTIKEEVRKEVKRCKSQTKK